MVKLPKKEATPIIMIIIVTSIQMYLDYYQELPRWKQKANKSLT